MSVCCLASRRLANDFCMNLRYTFIRCNYYLASDGLNFVPSNFYPGALTPCVSVFGDGIFEGVIKVK